MNEETEEMRLLCVLLLRCDEHLKPSDDAVTPLHAITGDLHTLDADR